MPLKGQFEIKDIEAWGESRSEADEIQSIPQKGAGIVIRWALNGRFGGELSFFTQNGRWHMDAEDLNEDTIHEILKAMPKLAVRKG